VVTVHRGQSSAMMRWCPARIGQPGWWAAVMRVCPRRWLRMTMWGVQVQEVVAHISWRSWSSVGGGSRCIGGSNQSREGQTPTLEVPQSGRSRTVAPRVSLPLGVVALMLRIVGGFGVLGDSGDSPNVRSVSRLTDSGVASAGVT
jgi:hypothetical protein